MQEDLKSRSLVPFLGEKKFIVIYKSSKAADLALIDEKLLQRILPSPCVNT